MIITPIFLRRYLLFALILILNSLLWIPLCYAGAPIIYAEEDCSLKKCRELQKQIDYLNLQMNLTLENTRARANEAIDQIKKIAEETVSSAKDSAEKTVKNAEDRSKEATAATDKQLSWMSWGVAVMSAVAAMVALFSVIKFLWDQSEAQEISKKMTEAQEQAKKLQEQAKNSQAQIEDVQVQVEESLTKAVKIQTQAKKAKTQVDEAQAQVEEAKEQLKKAQAQVKEILSRSQEAWDHAQQALEDVETTVNSLTPYISKTLEFKHNVEQNMPTQQDIIPPSQQQLAKDIVKDEGSASAFLAAGMEAYKNKKYKQAIVFFEQYLGIIPNDCSVLVMAGTAGDILASKSTNKGEKNSLWNEAEKKFESVTKSMPKYALPWYNWGNLLWKRADYETIPNIKENYFNLCEEKFKKAIDADPAMSSAWNNLGNMLLSRAMATRGDKKIGWLKDSQKFLKKAAELGHRNALYNLAGVAAQQGNLEESMQLLNDCYSSERLPSATILKRTRSLDPLRNLESFKKLEAMLEKK